MNEIIKNYEQSQIQQILKNSKVTDFAPGDTVKVNVKIKEGNKERVQIFEGMVLSVGKGHGVAETFTVRKISGGIGVEKVFPIHAPSIEKIEVLRAHKVRRANLSYLRKRSGKALRLPEVALELDHKEFEAPKAAEEAAPLEEEAGLKVEGELAGEVAEKAESQDDAASDQDVAKE